MPCLEVFEKRITDNTQETYQRWAASEVAACAADNVPSFVLFKFQEASPCLLPSLPTVGRMVVTSTQKDAENQSRVATGSVSSSRSSEMSSSKVCGSMSWIFKNLLIKLFGCKILQIL